MSTQAYDSTETILIQTTTPLKEAGLHLDLFINHIEAYEGCLGKSEGSGGKLTHKMRVRTDSERTFWSRITT